ncbi:MAG: transporter, partial [Vicinamibacteraceae bacterium]
ICMALVGALSIGASVAAAQPQPVGSSRPFEILDNSFLVEEAFNQERGVFQNIVGFRRTGDEWELAVTQEWPVGSQAHQLSFTIPAVGQSTEHGLGDVFLHYRFQLTNEAPGRPAISPRLSVILPTGNYDRGLGAGRAGLQINLPFSQQVRDVYVHWNAGFTYQEQDRGGDAATDEVSGFTPHLAASAIWRVTEMAHLMLEATAEFPDELDPLSSEAERAASWTVAPGLRGGWNLGDKQIIVGVAAPVVLNDDRTDVGGLLYFSYELPFRRGG